jgi:hypothetical protein
MAQGGVADALILLPLSGGIADTAGPAAGSSRSRMTQRRHRPRQKSYSVAFRGHLF